MLKLWKLALLTFPTGLGGAGLSEYHWVLYCPGDLAVLVDTPENPKDSKHTSISGISLTGNIF